MPSTRSIARIAVACALLVVAPSGCSGGCRKGTPYVPWLQEDAATSAVQKDGDVAVVDAPVDGGKAPSFQPVRATLAPQNALKFTLDGATIDAPAGNVIIAAIAHDLDGDGVRDVAAYVQPAGGGGGELRLYRGDEKGDLSASRAVTGSGSNAEIGLPAPCLGKPVMTLVGPHTISLDLRPSCGDAAPSARRFVLAAFAPSPSIRWSARVAEAPPGWSLTIDVQAPDLDGDGVDDPTFVFGLEGGGAPYEPGDRMVALVRYWDRPAGLSRDRTEPEKSFQLVSQQAHARATKKTQAITVAALVRRLRLLHGALCAEAGAPWIDVGGDHGVGCGASRGLEDASAAEVKASLTMGDVLSAMAARERLSSSPAAQKTTKTRAEIDRQILAAVPAVWATTKEPRVIPSTPSKGAPAWGALAFEKSGSLLVRTTTGVVRIDPATLEDADAPDVASWGWEVVYPGKDVRLTAVVDACEAPYLAARIAGHDVPTGAMTLPLPIMPNFSSGRCPEGKAQNASTTVVSWGGGGLFTLVEHEPVIIPGELVTPSGARSSGTTPAPGTHVDGPVTLGAPRSPSGSYLVVPTRFGLVRRDETGGPTLLVRAKDIEGLYGSLRECAIGDDGAHLACVREGKLILFDTAAAGDAGASESGG